MTKFKKSKIFTKTLVSSFISFASITAFANPIIPDNSQTQVQNVNNVPVVNIANPNGAGVSHNLYKEFNVETRGAVLNNSINGVNSQLAGYLNKNPNLSNSAKVIINEVVGGNQSQLLGKLEVAGNKANVLISNQNGIVINGASFVNSDSISLNTGKVTLRPDGALQGTKVANGKITIGERGLDATGANSVALISRALELNGKINAKSLFIQTGGNETDYKNKPQFAIDTKALGGMYANNIQISSTENGLGINLGNLQSVGNNDIGISIISSGPVRFISDIKSKKHISSFAPQHFTQNNVQITSSEGLIFIQDGNPYGTIFNK
ncbi:filamentous hemagglutinin N-terminal domain-containing protein [Xenorhabdus sp. BG5]|uniref:filamentous hemagglutinin N-terminal domain-containing protein n=1 Tax=Xenorhabdus sp. BG5 TaxID=2782014 RepID=UPI001882BD54|nr:filamentous hemagglutinin N-terminal domain-containing protein [Xenorhabdus sp. BG5]MBE8597846.1 filamentous hemagglutinin N-terminal domain-containing protein [Xenorhabdus sp. BG5]